MAIDFSLLKPTDFVGNAYAARQQGLSDGRQRGLQNAYATYAQDPEAGIKAISAYDPVAGGQLEDRQIARTTLAARKALSTQAASGDVTGARKGALAAGEFDLLNNLDKLDDRQRAELGRKATLGVQVGQALKALAPEQRPAYVQQQAPQLKAQGLSDQDIAGIPMDDVNIDAKTRQSLTVVEGLAADQKDREFKAGRDDETWKRGFEGKKFDHTVQNDNAQIGLGAERNAIARSSEGRQAAAAERAALGRPLPAPIAKGYGENVTALAKIDSAIAALKAHPASVGMVRAAGDNINQRLDPNGVDARAALADIGSQKLHDRSGAAVSASESPRLMPFIPQVTDTSANAIKKLTRLKQEYLSNNAQIETQFGRENGYQPLRSAAAPQDTVTAAAPSTVLRFDARGNRIK